MNWINFSVGLLCIFTAYYWALILWDYPSYKQTAPKGTDEPVQDHQHAEVNTFLQKKKKSNQILADDMVLNSLRAYDNSRHNRMVHVRFDKQTIDLMSKFKTATSVDRNKFIAFAVKTFFDTHPELKTIIKQFKQNAKL